MVCDHLRQTIDSWQQRRGISTADILTLPAPFCTVFQRMLRQRGLTLEELAAAFAIDHDDARELGRLLIEKGIFAEPEHECNGATRYTLRLANSRKQHAASTRRRASIDLLKTIESN
jgi:hypothetical protein